MKLKMLESFLTGHPVIDSEHRALVDAGNRILAAAESGPREKAISAIDDFIKRFHQHLDTEDRILKDLEYPLYGKHTQHHQRLLKDARAISAIFEAEGNGIYLFQCLTSLLIVDMVETDTEFVSFLIEKGVVK